MNALPSIRQRLSRTLVGVSLAWSVAVAAAVGLVVRHEMDELLDETLLESAQVLHGLLSARVTNGACMSTNSGPRRASPGWS